MSKTAEKLNLSENCRCKHGLLPEWCAYCTGILDKPSYNATGNGALRIYDVYAWRLMGSFNPLIEESWNL